MGSGADTQLGQSLTNDVVDQAGTHTPSKPYNIPSSKLRSKRQQLSDLETQQNNLMALSGGYMTTDISTVRIRTRSTSYVQL